MNNTINITDNEADEKSASKDKTEVLTNLEYLCKSTKLITDALRQGCDIAQLPNGDIMITEVKVVHMYYTWDKVKEKMTRVS